MKKVAVQGMTVLPVETGVTIEDWIVTTLPSTKVIADGKGVYSGDISVTVPAPTLVSGGFVAPSTVFTIHPSAIYSEADGKPVLLEGDTSDTITLTGTNPVSGLQATFPLTLKVSVAGQTSVTAE